MKISEKTCVEFVNLLASKSAVPGGGGAAALVGAIGMALGSMVCNLTIGKKKYAEYEDSVKEILVKAGEIEEKLLSMIDEDANNFLPLSKAYGLPTSTEEEKKIKEETNIEAFAAMSEENSELINEYKNNLYIVKTPKKGGIGLNDSLKNICKLAKSLSNKEDVSDLTKEICY